MRKLAQLFSVTILAFCALATLAQSPSLIGTWKLDVSKSDFGGDPAPGSLTLTILKDSPQMVSWRVRGVQDGKPFSYSWSGPGDGSMHPVIDASGKTLMLQGGKREPDGTVVRHGEDSSSGASFDAVSKLSDGGTTLVDTITSRSKDGKTQKQMDVFHRVDGATATRKAPNPK